LGYVRSAQAPAGRGLCNRRQTNRAPRRRSSLMSMHRSHSHGDVGRFDAWAASYERHWMQRLVFEPIQTTLLDLASEQVAQPRSILDVGCGTGRLLRTAAKRFPGALLNGV